ncbi:nucleotidyltransferase domain-containing protein [Streptomyces sp. KMM 9044]|nr:nucleotidyltransferase domain-containing protein [Streptomyces sp. KMM 9044]WAX80794.1 nucleotidyltransferase domain-containing protein [Streptomyces sp. KMM 9044]
MVSRAFGLATEGIDTDRRGVFLAPIPLFWRFEKPPAHVEGPAEEQFSWELERFCELTLRARPNVLECLHSPLVEHADDTGRELLTLRGAFLSRRVHETFTRYAYGQRRGLEADVRVHGAPRWTHAMHPLRLLASARDVLRTGEPTAAVGERREPFAPGEAGRGSLVRGRGPRPRGAPVDARDASAPSAGLRPRRAAHRRAHRRRGRAARAVCSR